MQGRGAMLLVSEGLGRSLRAVFSGEDGNNAVAKL